MIKDNEAMEPEAAPTEQIKETDADKQNANGAHTLLLVLDGLLQSWETYENDTKREPTKNGIVELLATALGRDMDEDLSDLLSLRLGVRVDQEGTIISEIDYDVDDINGGEYSEIIYLLSDAVFLVGLESSDEKFLEKLADALRNPARSLYLGKHGCMTTRRLVLGIRHTDLETALKEEEWQAHELYQKSTEQSIVYVRLIVDADDDILNGIRIDVPKDNNGRRYYSWRPVIESNLAVPNNYKPL